MPHTFDLLVVGDANPDIVLGPLDGPLAFGQREQLVPTGLLTLGGSAAIVACGAARLGLKVAFAGRIGDDDAGRYVRGALEARGVDTDALRLDPELPTPLTTVVTRADDRAILTSPGTLATTDVTDVPEALVAASRHVHVASYFLLPALATALPTLWDTARRHGATTSLDTNDDPSGTWRTGALTEALARTDFLLPNAQEALALAGDEATDLDGAAALLARLGPLVVVKNGAAGALAHDGASVVRTGGTPARPKDTVGAGDSFDAGFIAATLRGLGTERALEVAAACGSLSTRAHGGTPAQATWDEALAALTRNGKNQS
ncbi:carbohydrate kinase family protein [Streptomyces tsukubensis]|uniref:Carbohydrate kinase family protein n=1 Tax=Streptomyces tsukubensis TaxID=83656 RepID=A0A1V4A3A4_9ACTN|nr:carbohydrate kinase family protein [Streptomyces tsukubensis]OON73464.1 carbohydrate kinase family protein [Streptomyces tsukubensis]QFR96745.1 carbohydrate kinase family protein [Streptomyces tsukubensis]